MTFIEFSSTCYEHGNVIIPLQSVPYVRMCLSVLITAENSKRSSGKQKRSGRSKWGNFCLSNFGNKLMFSSQSSGEQKRSSLSSPTPPSAFIIKMNDVSSLAPEMGYFWGVIANKATESKKNRNSRRRLTLKFERFKSLKVLVIAVILLRAFIFLSR